LYGFKKHLRWWRKFEKVLGTRVKRRGKKNELVWGSGEPVFSIGKGALFDEK
jgi:hypothetical protein